MVAYAFEWGKLLQSHLVERLVENDQIDSRFMFQKIKLTPGSCLTLPCGCVHVRGMIGKFVDLPENDNVTMIIYYILKN